MQEVVFSKVSTNVMGGLHEFLHCRRIFVFLVLSNNFLSCSCISFVLIKETLKCEYHLEIY